MLQLSPGSAPAHRSWAGVTVSAALHTTVFAAAVWAVVTGPVAQPRAVSPAPTFVALVPPLPTVTSPPLVMPPPAIAPVRSASAPVAPPAPPPAPIVAVRREPPPRERPELPAAIAPARPSAPAVVVGAFADSPAAARRVAPKPAVAPAGFDEPAVYAPRPAVASATVGAFDTPTGPVARSGVDRAAPGVVADAGFGSPAAVRPTVASAPAVVKPSGFGDALAAPPPAREAAAPERIETPVAVLSKPTPAYSSEARALKLEGEVLLEVEFRASGEVTVLRVVRGLGHGLDEAAMRAAEEIRFKPASSAGRPVDARAVVHIVFRLT